MVLTLEQKAHGDSSYNDLLFVYLRAVVLSKTSEQARVRRLSLVEERKKKGWCLGGSKEGLGVLVCGGESGLGGKDKELKRTWARGVGEKFHWVVRRGISLFVEVCWLQGLISHEVWVVDGGVCQDEAVRTLLSSPTKHLKKHE